MLALLIAVGAAAGLGWLYYVAVLAVAAASQAGRIGRRSRRSQRDCLSKFRANRWIGWFLLVGIVLGRL